MENQKKVIYEDQDFESYKINNLGVMKIRKNVFEIVTDLPESSKFIQAMNVLEKDIKIDALIIFNENTCLGNNEYIKYLNNIFSHNEKNKSNSELEITNIETRTRELTILNSIIRKIVRSNKLIVTALKGEVVTPFFGTSLAADLRIGSENLIFLLSHSTMDVHPSGALPYFLPKYIGFAKASNILFSVDKITAKEALDLGLLYQILPELDFEESSIQTVSELIGRGRNTMKCSKRLLAYGFEDIDKYLNMEECNYLRR